jgi:hypothetical protein
VRTIEVAVHPLGGETFKVRLNATKPSVGEAKVEIARVQGIEEAQKELYGVAVRADGGAVREDDAEAEPLDAGGMVLGDGAVVAMTVKKLPPLVWKALRMGGWAGTEEAEEEVLHFYLWKTFAEDRVALSEAKIGSCEIYVQEGAVVTQIKDEEFSLTTTGEELTEGKHYWEVELLSEEVGANFIGICRPNLDPTGWYYSKDSTDGWFMEAGRGSLRGNGKEGHVDAAGYCNQGDRLGVLLDLDDGSLRFFRNGAQHGPGYPAGSVTGPVVAAVQLFYENHSVRLPPDVCW